MSLAPADPYAHSFEAVVHEAGREVVLEETYFYPEGGGQPADRGTVGGVAVEHVAHRDGRVVHELAEPLDADPGEAVACEVDPAFRTYCMRAHTASHALYGAGRRLFDDLGYGGFGITPEKVRVDLATPAPIDDEALVELERLVNRAVWDSRPVTWRELPREEALGREDVAFNAATEEGIEGDAVRIVTIDGWDAAACGGTHVSNTREVGPVTVLDRSNPGEGLTRVEFAVGPRAVDRRAEQRRAAGAAAAKVGASVRDLPDAVDRLRDERDEARRERDALQAELVERRLAALREDVVERDGRTWLVGTLDLDANALAERAGDLAGDAADVVALVAPDGGQFAVGAADGVDAAAVVADATDAFGGGGGGSAAVAQGGGLGASADAVVAFLRGERGPSSD